MYNIHCVCDMCGVTLFDILYLYIESMILLVFLGPFILILRNCRLKIENSLFWTFEFDEKVWWSKIDFRKIILNRIFSTYWFKREFAISDCCTTFHWRKLAGLEKTDICYAISLTQIRLFIWKNTSIVRINLRSEENHTFVWV